MAVKNIDYFARELLGQFFPCVEHNGINLRLKDCSLGTVGLSEAKTWTADPLPQPHPTIFSQTNSEPDHRIIFKTSFLSNPLLGIKNESLPGNQVSSSISDPQAAVASSLQEKTK